MVHAPPRHTATVLKASISEYLHIDNLYDIHWAVIILVSRNIDVYSIAF